MKIKNAKLLGVTVGLFGMLLTGCAGANGTTTEAEHVHSYGAWTVVDEASCTEDGLEIRNCDGCEAFEERPISATGHTMQLVQGLAPTKTEPGYMDYYECTVCHNLFEDEQGQTKILNLEEWKQNGGYIAPTFVYVSSIALVSSELSIERGGTATLTVTVLPEDADNKGYDLTVVSGADYISIDGLVVTGVDAGKAKIKAVAKDDHAVESNVIEIEVYKVPVTLTVNNGTGGGNYFKGDTVTATATVPENKEFVQWTSGGKVVSTQSPYEFVIQQDTELTAEFKYTDAYVASVESTDLLYKSMSYDKNSIYTEVTDESLLQSGSLSAAKLSATAGWPSVQFSLGKAIDMSTKRFEIDAKCLKGKAWFSMKFTYLTGEGGWGDVMNPDNPSRMYEMGQDITSSWNTYSFVLDETIVERNAIVCIVLVIEGEGQANGTEVLFDNLHIVDYSNEEWYVERNDLLYKSETREPVSGTHFEKVTEGLQEGSAAGILYYNDESTGWPSVLFEMPKSIDMTKQNLIIDAKLLEGDGFFSLKFYNSKWIQYEGIGSADCRANGEWNSYEFGRYDATDVKLIRITLNNETKGTSKLLFDNLRVDNENNGIFIKGTHVRTIGDIQFKTITAEEMTGKFLTFNYKLIGASSEDDYTEIVFENNWNNVSARIKLMGNKTANKAGVVTDLGNGWWNVVIAFAEFDGDGNDKTKIDAIECCALAGNAKNLIINYDSIDVVDSCSRELRSGNYLYRFNTPLANWKTSGKKIVIEFEAGTQVKGGYKSVFALRTAKKEVVGKFNFRMDNFNVYNSASTDNLVRNCGLKEGSDTVRVLTLAFSEISPLSGFDGTESLTEIYADDIWWAAMVHSVTIVDA